MHEHRVAKIIHQHVHVDLHLPLLDHQLHLRVGPEVVFAFVALFEFLIFISAFLKHVQTGSEEMPLIAVVVVVVVVAVVMVIVVVAAFVVVTAAVVVVVVVVVVVENCPFSKTAILVVFL